MAISTETAAPGPQLALASRAAVVGLLPRPRRPHAGLISGGTKGMLLVNKAKAPLALTLAGVVEYCTT